jgi:hypothetical protein
MMAIAEQQTVQPTPEPKQATRQQSFKWPTQAQLRRSAPIFALLAEIWAIPEIKKVSVLVDATGAYVQVFMFKEDRTAEHRIYAAERDFLNGTPLHNFELQVMPTTGPYSDVLPPFDTILER